MSCPDCEAAEREATWGGYRAGCIECQARALANGPHFYVSSKLGTLTPEYKTALRLLFEASWESGHAKVKAWARRIKQETKNAQANSGARSAEDGADEQD